MDRGWQQLAAGVVLLLGGLAALAVGTLIARTQPTETLVLLLLVPSVGALAGAVLLLIGVARRPIVDGRSQVVGRMVTLATIVGVVLGLGLLVQAIVSSIPAWGAGLTGILGVGFAVALSACFLIGAGLVFGLATGLVIALVWWVARGHRLPA